MLGFAAQNAAPDPGGQFAALKKSGPPHLLLPSGVAKTDAHGLCKGAFGWISGKSSSWRIHFQKSLERKMLSHSSDVKKIGCLQRLLHAPRENFDHAPGVCRGGRASERVAWPQIAFS